jgi:hypothetical protein
VTEEGLQTVHPSRLAMMLTVEGVDRWRPEEMAAILRHQLSSQLESDLAGADRAGHGSSPMTFGELLHHVRPPVALLERVKLFAKASKAATGPLPPQVATVLYFASIVVARLRWDARISSLDDDAIVKGTQWALAQSWLDQPTRTLFQEAAARLSPASCASDSVAES